MSTTISLISIPKEAQELLEKAERRGTSDEYSSVFFSLKSALNGTINTYGHKDWKEFKSDIDNLQKHYPNNQFEDKYYFNTYSRYEILEYLLKIYQGQKIEQNNRLEKIFFNSNIECDCKGRNFKYWNNKQLKSKLKYIESINQENLFNNYEPEKMKTLGVYKMEHGQNELTLIVKLFKELKIFLQESNKLNGYTILLEW